MRIHHRERLPERRDHPSGRCLALARQVRRRPVDARATTVHRGDTAVKMNFSRIMRALALKHRDREAIVNAERNRRYSYRDYHLLTNRIANALSDTLKVGAGDKFLLILENDNLSLMMLPTVLKQKGTVALTNLRDS